MTKLNFQYPWVFCPLCKQRTVHECQYQLNKKELSSIFFSLRMSFYNEYFLCRVSIDSIQGKFWSKIYFHQHIEGNA